MLSNKFTQLSVSKNILWPLLYLYKNLDHRSNPFLFSTHLSLFRSVLCLSIYHPARFWKEPIVSNNLPVKISMIFTYTFRLASSRRAVGVLMPLYLCSLSSLIVKLSAVKQSTFRFSTLWIILVHPLFIASHDTVQKTFSFLPLKQ